MFKVLAGKLVIDSKFLTKLGRFRGLVKDVLSQKSFDEESVRRVVKRINEEKKSINSSNIYAKQSLINSMEFVFLKMSESLVQKAQESVDVFLILKTVTNQAFTFVNELKIVSKDISHTQKDEIKRCVHLQPLSVALDNMHHPDLSILICDLFKLSIGNFETEDKQTIFKCEDKSHFIESMSASTFNDLVTLLLESLELNILYSDMPKVNNLLERVIAVCKEITIKVNEFSDEYETDYEDFSDLSDEEEERRRFDSSDCENDSVSIAQFMGRYRDLIEDLEFFKN